MLNGVNTKVCKVKNVFSLIYDLFLTGFNASARFVGVNTMYWGQCYLILANKHEAGPQTGTGLLMNLARNESVANLYLIPSKDNSEKSAAVDILSNPLEPFELTNHGFLKLMLSQEFHVRKSTNGYPCDDHEEDNFYKVRSIFSDTKENLIFCPSGSALLKS